MENLSTVLWQGLGSLIGYAAAYNRGFSRGIGAGFGFFAGPVFAGALFLISGVFTADEARQRQACHRWPSSRGRACHACGGNAATPSQARPGPLRLVFSRLTEEDGRD
jgi:hypothetical protein